VPSYVLFSVPTRLASGETDGDPANSSSVRRSSLPLLRRSVPNLLFRRFNDDVLVARCSAIALWRLRSPAVAAEESRSGG